MSQNRPEVPDYVRFIKALPLALFTAVTLTVLGCGPAADTIPSAQAQSAAVTTVAYPEVAPGAEDGSVYEYH